MDFAILWIVMIKYLLKNLSILISNILEGIILNTYLVFYLGKKEIFLLFKLSLFPDDVFLDVAFFFVSMTTYVKENLST